jgi:uncharacterized membrane protein
MSWQGMLLVLLSACCHAAWNLLSKTSGGPAAFARQALRWSALCYLPLFLLLQPLTVYSERFLVCVLASGLATGLFFLALSNAYLYGRISVAYPIARSFPILVVTWVAILWGRYPSTLGLVGILIIISGCFILPLQRFVIAPDGLALGNYLNRSCAWALAAALATSVFSVIDKAAAVSMPTDPAGTALATRIAYVYLQNLLAWVTVEFFTRGLRQPDARVQRPRAIVAGLIFLVSYALIVLALTFEPVAYVVSFRQLSIVMTALISMFFIEREFPLPRLVGVGLIFCGVLLVGLA